MDYSKEEIIEILNIAYALKTQKKEKRVKRYLKGKNIALLFEKDSTRTRCAFEVAAYDLGMNVTYLGPSGSQMGKKESVKDTARVLGRMYDGIQYRGFAQKTAETLAKFSGVPVWNGLTDLYHPTQALADILTMKEHGKDIDTSKIVFVGNCNNNVTHSLMVIIAKLGGHLVVSSPRNYQPNKQVMELCQRISLESKATIKYVKNPKVAVENADVVYTDVWVSMGEDPQVWKERILYLKPYQVNRHLLALAKEDVKYMHCLPSFHNQETEIGKEIFDKFEINQMEATDEVHESDKSIVFDQAENRLHTIKAVMLTSLSKRY